MTVHAPHAPDLSRPDVLPDAAVLAERRQAAALLRSACERLDPAVVPPEPLIRPGPTHLTLECAATVVLRDHADGHRSLARLAEALPGWDRRLAPGRVARLEARHAGRTVAASYVEDERVLVLTVVSASLPVTREQSRRLRGARGAREVAS
ncbi:hypothetical protein [Nocardioides plantarum]|uniref:Uncharacterized protein n=1 Tax=Nocardioides plantarum TaxID=29299 RepID=A0ABV5K8N0_9ACTN|nr:hypothetical protein [Nocardioides plantarum]